MNDVQPFADLIVLVAVVGVVAILSSHLTPYLRIPTPGLFLAGAAVAVRLVPELSAPPERLVTRLVTVALLLILFDGGMHIGWRRFNAAKWPILLLGVFGTFLTVAGTAGVAKLAIGASWYAVILVATAVAPTDPAVVFSVLGQREVAGRSGVILEGESGANDPVGIALMASLIGAGGVSLGAAGDVAGQFVLEMAVGAAIGLVGGWVLLWFMRRVALPSEGLYPLRTLASIMLLYGVATLAHGSGFLAVFVAGILIGDAKTPYKADIVRFHSALASLAEIVAFVALGLTVNLSEIGKLDVWVPGVIVALVLAVVVRPLFVGACLLPARLRRNELGFVMFSGLKGAVPILLGSYILTSDVHDARRLYAIVVVVVAFSVAVQGSLVPTVARALHLRMRTVEPEPWTLGVRLSQEPEGVHRLTVAPGSAAEGRAIADLEELPDDAWISFVIRDRRLVGVTGTTQLCAGDEVTVLAPRERASQLFATFQEARG